MSEVDVRDSTAALMLGQPRDIKSAILLAACDTYMNEMSANFRPAMVQGSCGKFISDILDRLRALESSKRLVAAA
jgi:hypothetical protein